MRQKKKLSIFEHQMLIGALRYYQYRSTIVSASFPQQVAGHYFSGDFSVEDEHRIAHQFAVIDHGTDGVKDWVGERLCDQEAWTEFYDFCKAYLNGFDKARIVVDGKEEEFECFPLSMRDGYIAVKRYLHGKYSMITKNSIITINGKKV